MTFVSNSIRSTDIYNDNFNHYFTERLNAMTLEEKKLVPNELSHKIFKYGNEASAERLNFNEKMWMLAVVFSCAVTITVEDNVNGLDIKDYMTAKKVQREGKATNGELLEGMRYKTAFVLGSKELMSSLLYMSHACCSAIYNLVKSHVPNAGHNRNEKFKGDRMAFIKTLAFIKNYEANKRRITNDYGLTMPEWYALVNFAIAEGFAIDFYKKDFVYSYNSSVLNLHRGLKHIYELGYLRKKRAGIRDKYVISDKGVEILTRIFTNILLKV